MTRPRTDRLFCFGRFEVDEPLGELRKQGIRMKLHSQPFQILVMLLERPGGLVTREEMRQRLWGEDTFVDYDHGLNTAINKIREALGDTASQPRFVETVSGKGYRFIAPVTVAAPVAKISSMTAGGGVVSGPASSTVAGDGADDSRATGGEGEAVEKSSATLLTAPQDLPLAPRALVRVLLLLIQAMYLAFYMAALANLPEILDLLADARLPWPRAVTMLLVTSAVVLIPVRLYLFAAVAFDFEQLPGKFRRLFPLLLAMDLMWALSPFLLVHHIPVGLALGMSAALVYLPFAQRSLILMYARGR